MNKHNAATLLMGGALAPSRVAVAALLVASLAGCGDSAPEAKVVSSNDAAASDAGGGVADAVADSTLPIADTLTADAGALDVEPAQGDAAAVDAAPAACSDAETKACNDGLACTEDACAVQWGKAVCSWTLKKDACLIGGQCRKAGEAKGNDACVQCLPEMATSTWSAAPDGTECDDGDLCTWQGKCAGKQCTSQPVSCDDKNPCTADVCKPASGCSYPPLSGAACDDGSACTSGDACQNGQCAGKKVNCNDGKPCTDDACDLAVGCTHTDNSLPCADGDACTSGDTCAGGSCTAGGPANCDDGNTCTLDICDKAAGCYHLPLQSPCCTGQTSICDDGNPCTSDDCDPKTAGCSHANNTALCDDGNLCTAGDVCKTGNCAGAPKTCDDKNPCTADACTPAKGCVFNAAGSAPCDDGNACTTGDVCNAGVCKGNGQCACKPAFATQVQKITSLLIGDGGKPGQALDLDDNPKTCAPSSSCSGGLHNALGVLAGIANTPLDKAVQDGSVSFVLELKDFKQGPINLALYASKLDPKNAGCDPQKATCIWQVDPKMLDAQCKAVVQLPGQLAGNQVFAGGKASNFPFSLPLSGGANLNITIYGARLQGTVVLSGDKVVSFDGILGGSVPKTTLLAAIDALPEDGLPAGLDKAGIKQLLDGLVEVDIDSDGDGTLDAASIGLKVKGIAGSISGTY